MSKTLVLDSSSLISLSEKCFMNIMGRLVQEKGWRFLIPKAVYDESVTRPMQISRFELNALRIRKAVDAGWLIPVESNENVKKNAQAYLEMANHSFLVDGSPLEILQMGEAEALALAKEEGAHVLVVDERTMRLFVEKPTILEFFLKTKHPILTKNDYQLTQIHDAFPDMVVCRSVELMILAFEQGLLDAELGSDRQALESALFALKYSGCAVSRQEIDQYLNEQFKA